MTRKLEKTIRDVLLQESVDMVGMSKIVKELQEDWDQASADARLICFFLAANLVRLTGIIGMLYEEEPAEKES